MQKSWEINEEKSGFSIFKNRKMGPLFPFKMVNFFFRKTFFEKLVQKIWSLKKNFNEGFSIFLFFEKKWTGINFFKKIEIQKKAFNSKCLKTPRANVSGGHICMHTYTIDYVILLFLHGDGGDAVLVKSIQDHMQQSCAFGS